MFKILVLLGRLQNLTHIQLLNMSVEGERGGAAKTLLRLRLPLGMSLGILEGGSSQKVFVHLNAWLRYKPTSQSPLLLSSTIEEAAIGEELVCEREPYNEWDHYAVSVTRNIPCWKYFVLNFCSAWQLQNFLNKISRFMVYTVHTHTHTHTHCTYSVNENSELTCKRSWKSRRPEVPTESMNH